MRHIHTPTLTQKPNKKQKQPHTKKKAPPHKNIGGQVNGRCRAKRTERAVARLVKRTGKRTVQGEADRKGNRGAVHSVDTPNREARVRTAGQAGRRTGRQTDKRTGAHADFTIHKNKT